MSDDATHVVVARLADGTLEARARDATLRVGRAADGAFRSVELLLAALGSCMLGTMLAFADNVDVELGEMSLELRPRLAERPERVERVEMTLRIAGDIPERRLASLRRVAERCKVHATLEHGPELVLTLER